MQIIETFELPGIKLLKPSIFNDSRGYFFEDYNKRKFDSLIKRNINFVQSNESFSTRGTIRGFHYQKDPFFQEKLIRVISGEIIDVALCIDKESKNFGKYQSVILNDTNKYLFWIPYGYAHAFQVLSEIAIVNYKTTKLYNIDSEVSIKFNDNEVNFDWPLKNSNISNKDKEGISLNKI